MKRIENKINEIEQLKSENDELIQEVENRIEKEKENLKKIHNKIKDNLSVTEKLNIKTKETERENNIKNLKETRGLCCRLSRYCIVSCTAGDKICPTPCRP